MKEAGIYFRVFRNGNWLNLDVLELKQHELNEILLSKSNDWIFNFIYSLCDRLKDINNTEPDPDHFRFQDGTTLEYKQERID